MAETLRNYLRGAGSLLDLFSPANYDEVVPRRSVKQSLEQDWRKIGVYFQASVTCLVNDAEIQERQKPLDSE